MITIACIVFRDQKTNFTDSVSGEHCARSSPLLLIEDPCGFPLKCLTVPLGIICPISTCPRSILLHTRVVIIQPLIILAILPVK